MNDVTKDSTCPMCQTVLAPGDVLCSQCRERLVRSTRTSQSHPTPRWYYNPWFVLVMLFFVMGPFGLPLVWKNPHFSRWVKIALTLAMALYTVLLVELTVKMVQAVLNEAHQLNSTFQLY